MTDQRFREFKLLLNRPVRVRYLTTKRTLLELEGILRDVTVSSVTLLLDQKGRRKDVRMKRVKLIKELPEQWKTPR